MPEGTEKTTVEEPPRTRRRGRVAAFTPAYAVLVLAGPFASSTVRTGVEVRWLARGLYSEDRAVREETRQRLLALGRPRIDAVFPEIVASEVAEHAQGGCLVFVGRVVRRSPGGSGSMPSAYYDAETVLGLFTFNYEACETDRRHPSDVQWTNGEGGPVVPESPTATLLAKHDAHRELVVAKAATMNYYFALTVPLDDDPLAPTIIEAVQNRLARTP